MPAPGSVWRANTWDVNAWAANTWQDSSAPVEVINTPDAAFLMLQRRHRRRRRRLDFKSVIAAIFPPRMVYGN
jgi:hypothetical protein